MTLPSFHSSKFWDFLNRVPQGLPLSGFLVKACENFSRESWPGEGDNPSPLNPFRGTGIHIPTKGGAGHDGQTASFLLFKVGGAPWPERDVISPRRGRDALDAISGRPAGGAAGCGAAPGPGMAASSVAAAPGRAGGVQGAP